MYAPISQSTEAYSSCKETRELGQYTSLATITLIKLTFTGDGIIQSECPSSMKELSIFLFVTLLTLLNLFEWLMNKKR